ncbi:MAG: hypothetical protein QNK37_33490 [Acidobacteriota bacterium]|nr:hypothetical protein [Acidobacteriota bacterium]
MTRVRIPLLLVIAGCFPALVILTLLRFEDGNLVVLGQEIAEYNLPRLLATLSSIVMPVLLLLPPAVLHEKEKGFSVTVALAPLLLLAPALLAGLIVGARGLWPCLVALFLLSLWLICLHLWLLVFKRRLQPQILTVLYALAWAASDYMEHLRLYVLPYLESGFLKVIAYAWWLLPQVNSGPHHVDEYLQAEAFQITPFLPTFIQLPLLAFALYRLSRKPQKSIGDQVDSR